MSNLNTVIENHNRFRHVMGRAALELPRDAEYLHAVCEMALSPENLHEDGEASREDVARKLELFGGAKQELEQQYADFIE